MSVCLRPHKQSHSRVRVAAMDALVPKANPQYIHRERNRNPFQPPPSYDRTAINTVSSHRPETAGRLSRQLFQSPAGQLISRTHLGGGRRRASPRERSKPPRITWWRDSYILQRKNDWLSLLGVYGSFYYNLGRAL